MTASLIVLIALALGAAPTSGSIPSRAGLEDAKVVLHRSRALVAPVRNLNRSAGIPRGRLPKPSEAPSKAAARPPQCIVGDHTYISPCTTTDSVGSSLLKTIAYSVFNTGSVADEYELTCQVVAPAVSCSVNPTLDIVNASSSRNVNVTVTVSGASGTGKLTLKAKSTVNGDSATGVVNVIGTRRTPVISTAPHNGDYSAPASCVADCFAATASFTTPAYISRDVPRSVTLLYSSMRAKSRGFVQVNVIDTSGAAPNTVSMRLKRGASWVTFSNGSTEIFFAGARGTSRLAVQFDAPDWVWLFTDTVYIRSSWTSPTETKEVKAVVRTPTSKHPYYYGAGWWVEGLQTANYFQGAIVITEASGSVIVFDSVSASGGTVTYTSPIDLSRVDRTSDWIVTRHYPDSTKVAFDAGGRIRSIKNRIGDSTVFGYAAVGGDTLVHTITDPAGKVINLAYNAAKRLTTITDPANRQIFLEYEANGDYPLTDIYGPDYNGSNGATTRLAKFYYSASTGAFMTRRVDARGKEWVYAYDSFGTLAADTAPKILIGVDSVRPITRFSSHQWLSLGGTSGAGTSASPYVSVATDSVRGVVTDPEGHVTKYWVDKFGQPTRIADPLGRITTISYNKLRPSVITAPNLSQQTFTYTGAYLTSSWKTGDQAIYYTYNDSGQLKQFSGTGRPTTNFYYDSYGRDSAVKVGTSPTRTTTYTWASGANVRWQLLSAIDADGHITGFHYDGTWGNLDSTKSPGGRVTIRMFDAFGRDSVAKTTGLPAQYTFYDKLNQVVKIQTGGHASGGVVFDSTTFAYDAGGLLTTVTDAKGQAHRFEYNNLGWKSTDIDVADSTKRNTRRYDRDGQLTSWTNRRLDTLHFTYDSAHRLLSKTGRNTQAAYFRYDLLGQVVVDSNAVVKNIAYFRDNGWTDSIVTEIAGRKFRRLYVPDVVFRLASMTIMDSDTVTSRLRFAPRQYFYGATTGILDSIRLSGEAVRFTHNNDRLRTATTTPARWTRRERYTSMHTKVEEEFERWPSSNPLTWRGIGTDPLGRITRLWQDSLNTRVTRYVFDSLGRLAGEDTATWPSPVTADSVYGYNRDSTPAPVLKRSYSYDSMGNERVGTGTDTAEYTTFGNRMKKWPGLSFGVDNDGNRQWKKSSAAPNDTVRYFWSAEAFLDSVKVGTSRTIAYAYDARGQLVRKRVNGTDARHFLWDQSHLLAELSGNGLLRIGEYAYYSGTDRPLALITGDTTIAKTRYYHQDMLRNVATVLGPTVAGDSVNQSLTYESFGKLEQISGALADTNRLRWKGLLWEGDSTQLYYVRNRWYDPETHRFLTEDPSGLVGGTNAFTFAGNDPTNGIDPFGLDACPSQPLVADANKSWESAQRMLALVGEPINDLVQALVDKIEVGCPECEEPIGPFPIIPICAPLTPIPTPDPTGEGFEGFLAAVAMGGYAGFALGAPSGPGGTVGPSFGWGPPRAGGPRGGGSTWGPTPSAGAATKSVAAEVFSCVANYPYAGVAALLVVQAAPHVKWSRLARLRPGESPFTSWDRLLPKEWRGGGLRPNPDVGVPVRSSPLRTKFAGKYGTVSVAMFGLGLGYLAGATVVCANGGP